MPDDGQDRSEVPFRRKFGTNARLWPKLKPRRKRMAGLHCNSPSNPLLTDPGAALVILGFLDLLPHHTSRLFQESSQWVPLNPTASIWISPVPRMMSMS